MAVDPRSNSPAHSRGRETIDALTPNRQQTHVSEPGVSPTSLPGGLTVPDFVILGERNQIDAQVEGGPEHDLAEIVAIWASLPVLCRCEVSELAMFSITAIDQRRGLTDSTGGD